jgi:hypothetical protein
MKTFLIFIVLFSSILFAKEKHLILAEGNGWFPHMAENLITNHKTISKLPFSGFVIVGNSFTDLAMKKGTIVSYEKVWDEVKGLKGLYKNQTHNFLQINIHFPGDFWDDKAWRQVSKNFATISKVSKDLGFKGIVFDDEPYSPSAKKMINFKFPSKSAIKIKPNNYKTWQKKGAEPKWVDTDAYANQKYTFPEHMHQVSLRFKDIMTSMTNTYPTLVTLVYLGPSLSHVNSNTNYPIVIDMGLPRENEYHGAIFTGLKQGLSPQSKLHDMGESYKYRKNKHFGYAYQWRKYDIAKDKYNDIVETAQHWILPKSERKTWAEEVQVGFMVFNKGQKSSYDEFTTLNTSSVKDIEQTLNKALKYSDEYVIFYPEEQDWLLPNKNYPLPSSWMKMMKRVYDTKSSH